MKRMSEAQKKAAEVSRLRLKAERRAAHEARERAAAERKAEKKRIESDRLSAIHAARRSHRGTTEPLPVGQVAFYTHPGYREPPAPVPRKPRRQRRRDRKPKVAAKVVKATPRLDEAVRRVGFGTYREYLLSAHWKGVKRSYAASWPNCRCAACGERKYQLHHVTYARLGSERLRDLVPLCQRCHSDVHQWHRDTRAPLAEIVGAIRSTRKLTEAETAERLAPYFALSG